MTRHERRHAAKYLDEIIPLIGASHTEVVDYLVSVPMRYAEVKARSGQWWNSAPCQCEAISRLARLRSQSNVVVRMR